MRFLCTGASGQFGLAFHEVASPRHEVVGLSRTAVPGRDVRLARVEVPGDVREAAEKLRPDWIVHAAAMTNVDGCERDPESARRVNAEGSRLAAEAAAAVGARLLYVSTDYVFDGARGGYREEDAVNPTSVYGRTKLEGERACLAVDPTAVVARTSAVFHPAKPNFFTWLVKELSQGRRVRVVHDQRVNPTLAHDLAEQTLALMEADAQGVFHAAGATPLSRLDAALLAAKAFGLDASLVTPVPMAEMDWPAPRPRDSTLDVGKVSRVRRPLTLDAALDRLRVRMIPERSP